MIDLQGAAFVLYFTETNRTVGPVTASQVASASLALDVRRRHQADPLPKLDELAHP